MCRFWDYRFHGEEGDLKEEYTDLETTLNEDVLKQIKKLPEIYDSVKEEEVRCALLLIRILLGFSLVRLLS